MRRKHSRLAMLLLGIVLSAAFALYAVPIPTLDLDALTRDSTLIVTGEIVSLRDAGRSKVPFNDSDLEVTVETGAISVDRTLKESLPSGSVSFETYLPDSPTGWRQVVPHAYSVFFLKADSAGKLQFTSPYYPSFSTVPGPPSANTQPIDKWSMPLKLSCHPRNPV